MDAIFNNITEAVGYTPLVKINKLGSPGALILAKLESKNPGGSIKDRIALSMINDAEEKGLIRQRTARRDRRIHLRHPGKAYQGF